MLKQLKIKNFQSHKGSEISFTPGLNIITGVSDSGKSSIHRADTWFRTNRPIGIDDMLSWYAGKDEPMEVVEKFDDVEITRVRSKEINSYSLSTEEEPLDTVGRDVPTAVVQAINMNDLNIQEQHKPYFLLDLTPGERAKFLNEITGLAVIDRLFGFLKKKVNTAKNIVKDQKEEIQALEARIEGMNFIESAEVHIAKIDSLVEKRNRVQLRIERVENHLQILKGLHIEIAHLSKIISAKKYVDSLTELLSDRKKLAEKVNRIDKLVNDLAFFRAEISNESDWLKVKEPFEELQTVVADRKKLHEKVSLTEALLSSLASLRVAKTKLTEKATELKSKYRNMLIDNKRCPTCNTIITHAMVKEIFQQ